MTSLPVKLIPFVSPTEETPTDSFTSESTFDTGLSGIEVSNFYNSLVSSSAVQQSTKKIHVSSKKGDKKNASSISSSSNNVRTESIFLYAQQGDIARIKQCLRNGCSINQQDRFGWTPIMCATCEGHFNVVEYLIKLGADLDIKCNHGMTVVDIARKTRNDSLIKLLKNPVKIETTPSSQDDETKNIEKFCTDCETPYRMPTSVHERSIAHLLKTKKSTISTFYHIPENNKGFQMMLKNGWDKNKGLGVNADGRKFPIKTVFKKDRSCIGKTKEVAKVTHFNANDETSVTSKERNPIKMVREKTLKKWERKRLHDIQRQREINFRRQFNSDLC